MDILGTARRLEAALSERFDRAVERVRAAGPRTPLEVAHVIVEAVARHVQPGGRGRYVFPYNRVKVSVLAATKDARARLEAVLEGEPSLESRVLERLDGAGCDTRDIEVRIVYVADTDRGWIDHEFHLELHRQAERPRARPSEEAALELAIEKGTADQARYTFATTPVNLGRCADVRDSRHRLIRSNHVAFVDAGADVNASVSRQHAHITYDEAAGHHRVCDDRSAHGTSVSRAGRIMHVPPGGRGVRIQSGDVIVLGDARVRVTLLQP
jgi:hypothetical protein